MSSQRLEIGNMSCNVGLVYRLKVSKKLRFFCRFKRDTLVTNFCAISKSKSVYIQAEEYKPLIIKTIDESHISIFCRCNWIGKLLLLKVILLGLTKKNVDT